MEIVIENISGQNTEKEEKTIREMISSMPEKYVPKNFPNIVFCATILQAYVECIKRSGEKFDLENEEEFVRLKEKRARAYFDYRLNSVFFFPYMYDEYCEVPFEFIVYHEIGHSFYSKFNNPEKFDKIKNEIAKLKTNSYERYCLEGNFHENIADNYSIMMCIYYFVFSKHEMFIDVPSEFDGEPNFGPVNIKEKLLLEHEEENFNKDNIAKRASLLKPILLPKRYANGNLVS